MTTVTCRECGKETSTTRPAEDCHHCGAPRPWLSHGRLDLMRQIDAAVERRNYHTREFHKITGISAILKRKELEHHSGMESAMIDEIKTLEAKLAETH